MRADLKRFARQLRRNQTDAEQHLWYFLRNRHFFGLKFRRQHRMGSYIVDFCCLEEKIIIELDGSQHQEQVLKDQERDDFFNKKGFKVLRFWNHEVLKEAESVLESIRKFLFPSPCPLPRRIFLVSAPSRNLEDSVFGGGEGIQ